MPERDPMYGPPPGNPLGPARASSDVPFDRLGPGSPWDQARLDPAFNRPIDATTPDTKARSKLIYRDNPLVAIQNTWTIDEIRSALYAHMAGIFYASGMLCDSMLGDDRVTSTLNSRAAGWLSKPVRFKAADDSDAARECRDAWVKWWPRLAGDSAIRETFDYGTMMGACHDQLVWDTAQKQLDYAPTLRPWHPVFTWYDWSLRCYQAIGQDATIPIIPGDGKWLEYAPYGSYRGWIRGAIRPCAEPWTLRHYGFRDMARFGEVHGNPTRVGEVPMVGDPIERKAFEDSLARLGADTTIMLPRGVDPQDGLGYNYRLVEAQSQAWEVHPTQIDRCDMAIVLALLMVNLTTQVEGGSYGAAKVQMDVRSEGAEHDSKAWARTIYRDVARPFAYLNFGDADLAPMTWWDVTPPERYAANARQFQAVGSGIETLRRGGMKFADVEEVRTWIGDTFGLPSFPMFSFVEPDTGAGGAGKDEAKSVTLAPADIATVVTVDEARASVGLPAMPTEGSLTVPEYKAKHAVVIAEGTAATDPPAPTAAPPVAEGESDTADDEEPDDADP